MSRAWSKLGLRSAALLVAGLVFAAGAAQAGPRPGAARRHLNLFSGILGRENVNRFDCGLNAFGEVCVDPNGSTTVGGGFWPKGTPDQYVFNSGLQVAGIVDAASGFAWAGDTVGAFFFDPKGTTVHGDKLSLVWSSLDPTDVANWPRDAYILPGDTTLFSPILVGFKSASQQDSWIQYWDGNPQFNNGRKHPLGVLVTQRGLAWNFGPTGNNDIIYYLYTFTNITASDPSVYAGLPNADSLTNLGVRFQALNDAAFGITIPSGGYTIDSMYAAFSMDADVSTQAKLNYTSAFLPFAMGFAYKASFFSSDFLFPSSIFGPPFAPGVGFVGVKYLKSPLKNPAFPDSGQVGLTLYSNTINGGQFDDAQNTVQLWRYLSGLLNPAAGDAPCSEANPSAKHVCYVTQAPDDIRFFQSSGPLSLKPGQSQTIVVAYMGAAPLDLPVIANRGPNFDLKPGLPVQPESLAAGTDTLRSIDHVIGVQSIVGDTGGAPTGGPNGKIDQNEVRAVPRSLLGKALSAQAVFDGKFLLPFPPDAPQFFLVPGDNAVTVVWRPSATETTGDPYFAVASNNTSVLYDPNYRQFDVEGYRVYRGRTKGDLQLVAQFDYAGTSLVDFTSAFDYGNCAPELGVTVGCPAPGDPIRTHELVGPIVQVPSGGRVQLINGNVLVISTDTAVTGGGNPSGFPQLSNTGVPFAYTDRGVRNGFTYYYAVTAFDVNSVASVGPGSTALESAPNPEPVVPRGASGQEGGSGGAIQVISGTGATLDPNAPMPALDATTGEFAGPIPPANGLGGGFPVDVTQMIATASADFKIDSVVIGNSDPDAIGTAAPAVYFVTFQRATLPPFQVQVPVNVSGDVGVASGIAYAPNVAPVTGAKVGRFGGDSTFNLSVGAIMTVPGTWQMVSYGRASINGAPGNSDFNGPRWWTGSANENTADPNSKVCSASGGCSITDFSANAGSLPGVTIFHVQAYSTVRSLPQRDLEGVLSTVFRAADFSVYWGTGGAIDSVIDDTHQLPVAYDSIYGPTWGILNDSSFAAFPAESTMDQNNGLLTWTDPFCVGPVPSFKIGNSLGLVLARNNSSLECPVPVVAGTPVYAKLMDHARLSPIAIKSSRDTLSNGYVTTGNGFIFYLNGNNFLMQMASLPTAGTVWHARFYAGNITGSTGSYAFVPAAARPPAVPGLRVHATFTGTTFTPKVTSQASLDSIHTVPDPYYVTDAFEQSTNSKILRFVHLPSQCIVRIYSLSGVLVNALTLNDPTGGGELTWNLRNRNNQFVASGVYFFHVETPDGKTKIGKFTVVNFAQ